MVEQKLLGKGGNDMQKIKIRLHFEENNVLIIENEMSEEQIKVDTESKTIKAEDLVDLFNWQPNTLFKIDTSSVEKKNKQEYSGDAYRLYEYVLELLDAIQKELNKLSEEICKPN